MQDNKKKKKKKQTDDRPGITPIMLAAETIRREGRGLIESDILGSYTGTPADGGMPEQDADDL